jgi:hypothetical protein
MDVFGGLRACYATVLDIGTDRVMRLVTDRFDSKLPIRDDDLEALRSTARAVVAKRLVELLGQQVAETETYPDVSERHVGAARQILIDLLAGAKRDK